MTKHNKIKLLLLLIITLIIILIIQNSKVQNSNLIHLEEQISIRHYNDSSILNISNYYDVLKALEVDDPEKVLAQALLETGYFSSNLCKTYNNTLGLYNSYTKNFFRFESWQESILYYKILIEYKKKEGEDHYNFLKRIGYAEDPNYISKVERIRKNLIYKNIIK